MKRLGWVFLFGVFVAMVSCKKDSTTAALSADEAAEQIALVIGGNSSGLTSTIEQTTTYTSKLVNGSKKKSSICGYTVDTTLSLSNAEGSAITYSYNYNYGYSIECTLAGILDAMNITLSYTGNFESARFTSSTSGKGDLAITGIDEYPGFYNFNGTFTRKGSTTSKVLSRNSVESTTTITLTDVRVNMMNSKIWGGAASITISGTVPNKGAFSYTASLTFNGDETATLTIGNTTYKITLATGNVG